MFKFGLTNSDRCSCNQGVEDTFHFFCFFLFRDILQTQVVRYAHLLYTHYYQGPLIVLKKKKSEIISSVLKYINYTKRFSK